MNTSGEDKAFYMLGEQIGRMADEVASQREAHVALLAKFGEQSTLLGKLAERLEAHNRLIDERKNTDHNRILTLETNQSMLIQKVDDLERWKWRVVGLSVGLIVAIEMVFKLASWIT